MYNTAPCYRAAAWSKKTACGLFLMLFTWVLLLLKEKVPSPPLSL